jgi:hypothetical protein
LNASTPTTDYQGSAAPIEPPRFRGRKLLFGCLISAVVVVGVIILVIAAFVGWVRTPGVPMEPARLFSAETVFYAELQLRSEDPGVREFIKEVISEQQELERQQRSQVPAPMRSILEGLDRRDVPDAEFERILPIIVAVTQEGSQFHAESPFLFALSLPRMGNRLRLADMVMSFFAGWAAEDSDLRLVEHGDEVIYQFDPDRDPLWICMVGSDVLVSRDEEALKAGIDRLTGAAAARARTELPSFLDPRPEESMLFVGARSGHGPAAVDLVSSGVPPFGEALAPIVEKGGDVRMWAGFTSSDVLEGEIHGSNADSSAEGIGGTVTAPLSEGEVTLSVEPLPVQPAGALAWHVKVTGITWLLRHGVFLLEESDESDESDEEE